MNLFVSLPRMHKFVEHARVYARAASPLCQVLVDALPPTWEGKLLFAEHMAGFVSHERSFTRCCNESLWACHACVVTNPGVKSIPAAPQPSCVQAGPTAAYS